MSNLKKMVVIITGASSGIGQATARKLAESEIILQPVSQAL
jgi:NADP-dependent 3-hydroxy acid dehydrogenase YdfG